jgi:hypothetical protein
MRNISSIFPTQVMQGQRLGRCMGTQRAGQTGHMYILSSDALFSFAALNHPYASRRFELPIALRLV